MEQCIIGIGGLVGIAWEFIENNRIKNSRISDYLGTPKRFNRVTPKGGSFEYRAFN
jgi:hypothetical protein